MENNESFNGFTNYETWTVSLWMSNDEASYKHFRELAREVREAKSRKPGVSLTKHEVETASLAVALRDDFEQQSPVAGEASVYADLLNAAFAEVDWYGLASDLLDEIMEDARNAEK